MATGGIFVSLALAEQFIVIKGYIDAKDERQRTIYGTFMAVVSRRDIRYLDAMFGLDLIAKETGFDDLYAILHQRGEANRDAAFLRDEGELCKFLDVSRTLQGVAKNRNAKQAEQTISRFCADNLHLKAVTFVEFVEATDSYLARFAPEEKKEEELSPPDPVFEPDVAEDVEEKNETKKDSRDFVVRCEPVLDPVRGVAMSELSVGDYVCAKLPENSVFYKLFLKNFNNFDGIINAQVSGILVNELGTATVSLELADGVAGVMKMSGKVRIKTAASPDISDARAKWDFDLHTLPAEIVFGLAAIFVLICAIGLLVYLMA